MSKWAIHDLRDLANKLEDAAERSRKAIYEGSTRAERADLFGRMSALATIGAGRIRSALTQLEGEPSSREGE